MGLGSSVAAGDLTCCLPSPLRVLALHHHTLHAYRTLLHSLLLLLMTLYVQLDAIVEDTGSFIEYADGTNLRVIIDDW